MYSSARYYDYPFKKPSEKTRVVVAHALDDLLNGKIGLPQQPRSLLHPAAQDVFADAGALMLGEKVG